MTRYVALLRGINVGGRNKVPMAELRELLGGLGYTDVKTLLQSGNAVFTAEAAGTAEVAAAIEKALAETYGREIKVMVRTGGELRAAAAANPLAVTEPARFLVNFYAEPVDAELLAEIDADAHAPERFAVTVREVYFDFPSGVADAKLPLLVDRKLKVLGTARNWNTVTKLLAMLGEGE